MTIVCLYLPLANKVDAMQCQTPIFNWLIVQAVFYSGATLRNLFIIWLVYNVNNHQRIKRTFDIFYMCIFMNMQICWLAYGNTFHYSDNGYSCKEISDGTRELWILMMLILAFGYVLFVGFLLVCFSFCLILILTSLRRPPPRENDILQASPRVAAS